MHLSAGEEKRVLRQGEPAIVEKDDVHPLPGTGGRFAFRRSGNPGDVGRDKLARCIARAGQPECAGPI